MKPPVNPPPLSPGRAEGFAYDAFGSYSTGADYRLIRKVEGFLETFHRLPNPTGPPLPALELCVDGSDFSIARAVAEQRRRGTAGQTNEIEELVADQLKKSARLLIFCPGRKRQGRWSDWETRWFLSQRSVDDIFPVITHGRNPWRAPAAFFSESILAAGLHERIAYDLRGHHWWRSWAWTNVRDFDDEIARMAADLYGRTLSEVQPVWLRQRQRTLRLIVRVSVSISVALVMLASYATFQRTVANERRAIAEHQTHLANARQLAAQSMAALGQGFPQRSLLLAAEALRRTSETGEHVIDADQALRSGLAYVGGTPLRSHERPVWTLALSRDGNWLATGAEDRKLILWNPSKPDNARVLGTRAAPIEEVQFSPDSRWLAARTQDHRVELWDVQNSDASEPVAVDIGDNPVVKMRFSPGGRWLAITWEDGSIFLRDLAARDAAVRRLLGHSNPVTDLDFTRDEMRLATASDKQVFSDGTSTFSMQTAARVWDLSEPSPQAAILRGHAGAIVCLAISGDGKYLLTGGSDQTVIVWDLALKPIEAKWTLRGHTKGVSSLAVAPGSRWAASGGYDGTACVWDLGAPDPARSAVRLPGHGGTVLDTEFSNDGRWLLTHGTKDAEVSLWSMEGERPASRGFVLRGHTALVQLTHFSENARWVLTAGDDKVARLWDLQNPDPSAAPVVFAGHEDSVAAAAVSANGRWLAIGSGTGDFLLPRRDCTARLWDLQVLQPTASPEILRVDDEGGFAVTRPDGAWVATRAAQHQVRLWRLRDRRMFLLPGHTDKISRILFSGDGHWLATASEDGTARLFDLARDDPSAQSFLLAGHSGAVLQAEFSPDGRWLATGDNENSAMLWELRASDPSQAANVLPHSASVTAIAWSPDSGRLITGSSDRWIRVWNTSGVPPAQPVFALPGQDEDANLLAVSGDGRWLASAPLYRHAVYLWDLRADHPQEGLKVLDDHRSAIHTILFSKDHRWLATASADSEATLYDLHASPIKVHHLAAHTGDVTALAFDANSRWLASGSLDDTVQLWNLREPGPGDASIGLHGHSDSIKQLLFTPAGEHLLSGSADGTVRIWRLAGAVGGELSLVLPSARGEVLSLEVMDSGRSLVTGASDGIRIWPLSSEQLLAEAQRVAGRQLRPDEAAFLPQPAPPEPTLIDRAAAFWKNLRTDVWPR